MRRFYISSCLSVCRFLTGWHFGLCVCLLVAFIGLIKVFFSTFLDFLASLIVFSYVYLNMWRRFFSVYCIFKYQRHTFPLLHLFLFPLNSVGFLNFYEWDPSSLLVPLFFLFFSQFFSSPPVFASFWVSFVELSCEKTFCPRLEKFVLFHLVSIAYL